MSLSGGFNYLTDFKSILVDINSNRKYQTECMHNHQQLDQYLFNFSSGQLIGVDNREKNSTIR